ncbi:hypothetical protein K4L44_00525 [Halosquirtibacter laminarini]|uniref:Uncharacterized protein n=1 Tax=Halosquirtibacter laminarini TaxID=3374600 RepID=A0AC61NFL3_9BACT|nr:hypothetical protein K4L44_00525 [Prolixibacteraceae bacterium]
MKNILREYKVYCRVVLWLVSFSLLLNACKLNDEVGFSGGDLAFSTDTIMVDTLFADHASKVYNLKVYNPSDKNLLVHHVSLQGGDNSVYKVNVDGMSGSSFQDISILPKDSLFLFIKAKFPSSENSAPILMKDSIFFKTDMGTAKVLLIGWNQNFERIPSFTDTKTVLKSDKPYLVSKMVEVPVSHELIVKAGTQLYFDLDAGVNVKGRVIVEGTSDSFVQFYTSNRDTMYRDVANQWKGLYFASTSRDNKMSWCDIRNANSGCVFEEGSSAKLDHLKMEKMTWTGIQATNASLHVSNSLIADVRYYAVLLQGGGDYFFDCCTLTNFNSPNLNGFRTNASLFITDNIEKEEKSAVADFHSLVWRNSIVEGPFYNEVEIVDSESAQKVVQFEHCLLRCDFKALNLQKEQTEGSMVSDRNTFIDNGKANYHLSEKSLAKGLGIYTESYSNLDLDGLQRGEGSRYDVGCYRWTIPKKEEK